MIIVNIGKETELFKTVEENLRKINSEFAYDDNHKLVEVK